MFLEFLKAKGIDNNVGLYKATNGDLTQWSRLVLNDNGNPIEIPCN